jgi:hypothetical protein
MRLVSKIALVVSLSSTAPAVLAGAHTWDVWEVFSNADGTVQFVEIRETGGGAFETGIGGHAMIAMPSGTSFTIPAGVASPTSFKSYLIATSGFVGLPGAPTPNAIESDGFLFTLTDTSMQYNPYDTATWTAGSLPLDGVHSLQRTGVGGALAVAVNSPTNYAGQSGAINVIPGVPGLTVSKLSPDGSSLSIAFNTATCGDAYDHQILFGQKSGLPAAIGGTFTLLGGACDIGTASPYTWNATPTAADGSGLIWFVVVGEDNAGKEGPWGRQTGNVERSGPGTNGASNVCSAANKDLNSTCGN